MSLLVAPIQALTDPMLTESERRALLALFSFRGNVTELVFPSLETLAERSLMKDKTRISKITTSLSKKGWLVKKKKGLQGVISTKWVCPNALLCRTQLPIWTQIPTPIWTQIPSTKNKPIELTNITNQYNKPI